MVVVVSAVALLAIGSLVLALTDAKRPAASPTQPQAAAPAQADNDAPPPAAAGAVRMVTVEPLPASTAEPPPAAPPPAPPPPAPAFPPAPAPDAVASTAGAGDDTDPFNDPAPGRAPARPADGPVTGCAAHYGTALDFVDDPAEAAKQALRDKKLLFVIHVAGNFEDSKFT